MNKTINIGLILVTVSALLFSGNACAYTQQEAILAVLGEESNYDAQVIIGATLRKRGSLKGVFGHLSKRIREHRYTKKEYVQASLAWEESVIWSEFNATKIPDGWGCSEDVKKWRTQAWFNNCRIVAKVGKTYFWVKK
jgi:hypothetical protein